METLQYAALTAASGDVENGVGEVASAAVSGGDDVPGQGRAEGDGVDNAANAAPNTDAANKKNFKRKSAFIFRPEHEVAYGVKPYETDPITGDVAVARCIFCVRFGRERSPNEAVGGVGVIKNDDEDGGGGGEDDDDNIESSSTKKRKIRALSRNVAFFKAPFRTDK